jgi:hypothetical protein
MTRGGRVRWRVRPGSLVWWGEVLWGTAVVAGLVVLALAAGPHAGP